MEACDWLPGTPPDFRAAHDELETLRTDRAMLRELQGLDPQAPLPARARLSPRWWHLAPEPRASVHRLRQAVRATRTRRPLAESA
jgi:hypothetical protein